MGVSSSVSVKSTSVSSVDLLIKEDCVVIFSSTTCGYCRLAKKVFADLGEPVTVVELNKRPDGGALSAQLTALTGARTVPQVFVNGQCIGGGTETLQLHKEGKLLPLIAQCASR